MGNENKKIKNEETAKILDNFYTGSKVRIIITGLSSSGKTTLLWNLNPNQENPITEIEVIGSANDKIVYKNNIEIIEFDCSPYALKPLWKHIFFPNTNAIIFVIDFSNQNQIELAKSELEYFLNSEDLKNVKNWLILANKIDQLEQRMEIDQLVDQLKLNENDQLKGRKWKVFGCNSLEISSVFPALNWLSSSLNSS